jgi:transcriptional regulator with XRE-family HTH domain
MSFKNEIAKIFKEAREKNGWTQEEVAKKAKVSVNYYARIERADPMPRGDVLDRIAKALGIKIKLPLES